jgi:predicted molibdopterin-dependent oxidoreductase YjgC
MFARLPDARRETVAVTIDGAPFEARAGDTVAAALLASGRAAWCPATVPGVPRGPFCLTGVCGDCLVSIDERANQQACLVLVAPGMRIRTQGGTSAPVPKGDA